MKTKLFLGVLSLALIIVGISAALPAQTRPQLTSASEPKPFDHSQCQYPARTTNPPNGCDNSDPANPYCAVKGLPEDCTEGQEQPKPQKKVTRPPKSIATKPVLGCKQ